MEDVFVNWRNNWLQLKSSHSKDFHYHLRSAWFAGVEAAQQGVHLTALRRGLAVSILFNVILLAVVLLIVGGR
jgi:hypothetical protein